MPSLPGLHKYITPHLPHHPPRPSELWSCVKVEVPVLGSPSLTVPLWTQSNTELEPTAADTFRDQELCESRGGRPGLHAPNSSYGLCGGTATLNLNPPRPCTVRSRKQQVGNLTRSEGRTREVWTAGRKSGWFSWRCMNCQNCGHDEHPSRPHPACGDGPHRQAWVHTSGVTCHANLQVPGARGTSASMNSKHVH